MFNIKKLCNAVRITFRYLPNQRSVKSNKHPTSRLLLRHLVIHESCVVPLYLCLTLEVLCYCYVIANNQ